MSTPRASARICRSIGSPPNVPQTATSPPERQLLQLADNLLSQFAGRRQDNGLRPASSGFEHLDQGNSERRGLARARLGLADDIESIERLGNKGRLNGGGRQVADLLEGLEHGRAQAHGWEPDSGFLLLNSSNQSILQKQSSVISDKHLDVDHDPIRLTRVRQRQYSQMRLGVGRISRVMDRA